MIKKTKEYLLRTHISSNLSIKGLDYESIVASGLDYLIVSLDGVSQDVYSKYRKNGNVDLVLNNMCSLISKKRQLGVKRPYIVWQYLVFEHNVHETDLAKKIASEIGVDELHLAKPYSVSWDYPDIIVKEKFNNERIHYSEYIPHLINDIKALPNIEEKQLDFTLFENLIPISSFDKTVKNHNKKCSFLYNTITLDANNRILPCCTSPVKGKKSLIFDHFSDNNYSFNNEFYIEARKQAFTLSGQECSADKTYCHYCSYNGTGMFTTHEEGRAYLLNIGNCEINNCMNTIINKTQ